MIGEIKKDQLSLSNTLKDTLIKIKENVEQYFERIKGDCEQKFNNEIE